MIICDRKGRPLEGAWFLTPHRSRLSTSGMTGRLQFLVADAVIAGKALDWVVRVELLT